MSMGVIGAEAEAGGGANQGAGAGAGANHEAKVEVKAVVGAVHEHHPPQVHATYHVVLHGVFRQIVWIPHNITNLRVFLCAKLLLGSLLRRGRTCS